MTNLEVLARAPKLGAKSKPRRQLIKSEFKNLKPFSFQLSIPTYISLFVQDVERIHFDQRWSEKKLDHLSLRPDDRCHFELC